jgi:hypothetical protein
LARVAREAIHFLPKCRAQALPRVLDEGNLRRDVERQRGREHPVQDRTDQLISPLEMEVDEAVAEPRSGGNGSDGEAVDSLPQRDIVRRFQDLLSAEWPSGFPSRHARSRRLY